MNDYYLKIKRATDVLVACLLLVFLSWLFLLLLLCYLGSLQFPVIFRQIRIGRNEKPFVILKFRTLSSRTDLPFEKRQFFLGKVLRYTNLDELPQLWNILKGDMSLVGPRPLPIEYLPLFSIDQRRRHSVFPGVTGWAQVNGRHAISWTEKFRLDRYYVDNLSASLDMMIILKTITLFFSPRRDISLDEKPFAGEH